MNKPLEDQQDSRENLLIRIPPLIIIAGNLATRAGNKMIFGDFDLTVHHFAMLQNLKSSKAPLKMADLREVMFNSQANVTQQVDALEGRGLVRRVRSNQDRRVVLIELTESGESLLAEIEQHYYNRMVGFLADVETGEMQHLAKMLMQWIEKAAAVLGEDADWLHCDD